MPLSTFNLQWNNANAQRAYPLVAHTTKTDTTSAFTLPDDFIVGLYLPVSASNNVQPSKFFVKTVSVFSVGFSVVIGYDSETGIVPVASSLIARSTHVTNQSYALSGMGDFVDTVGRIMIGQLDGIDTQPAGQFEFLPAATGLETDVVRPIIRGLGSISVTNNNITSERLYGDIELIAGANMRMTVLSSPGADPQIVFDAIDGEGLTEDCICIGETASAPITAINGVRPTPDGNMTFVGSSCLQISALANGLQFDDICSDPCCGCTELETITEAMEALQREMTTMKNFLTNLEGSVRQMDQVVLGSKLGDRGCETC